MDKPTDDIAADHSEQPQNQKNDSNGPKHVGLLTEVLERLAFKRSLALASGNMLLFLEVAGVIKRVNGGNSVFRGLEFCI